MIDEINRKHYSRKPEICWNNATIILYCILLVVTFAARLRAWSVIVIRATRGLDGTDGGRSARPAFGNAESVLVFRLFRSLVLFSLSRRRCSKSTCVFPRSDVEILLFAC